MADVNSFLGQSVIASGSREFLSSFPGRDRRSSDLERIGIAGFTMYVALKETRVLSSQAPDISLEDGAEVTDTVFLSPVRIQIEGEVSDVHLESSQAAEAQAQIVAALGNTAEFLPPQAAAALAQAQDIATDATNALRRLDDLVANGNQLLSLFGDKAGGKPLQEQFLDAMDALHFSRQLVTLESPYRLYDNVRITNFTTIRDNESDRLRFTIEAKQLRFTAIEFTAIEGAPSPSPGLNGQAATETDKGVTPGQEVESSLASQLLGAFR